ncbi:MAG: S41 family peptidase [Actinobacteria bacterium]|nr:MAG: S41 family peptidase [Actinomycetota bacterium]
MNGAPQVQRRRGFIMGFGAGAVAALGVAALIAAIAGDFSGSNLTSQASQVIRDEYFKPVKSSVLNDASVNGIIRELRKRYDDRFSHYLNPHQLRQFESLTSGRFSGVGLTVTGVKRGLRVASVLPRTPAQGAGIKEGDLITAVDGRSLAGVPTEVATARIKGPPWTPIELRLVSGSGGATRNIRLKRASVAVPVAVGEIKRAGTSKVAYVSYATFSQGAHGELSSTLERLDRHGAQGLVLDLRGNGGGLLNEAVLSASLFLAKGQLVVSTDSRTMGHRDYDAIGNPLSQHPTVVLINHDTASAAEILASALEDHHLATIVGTRSFGKGTFQEVIHLAAGGALDLTVGQYFTANGISLANKGIKPDVRAVDDPKTPQDEALRRALAVLAEKMAVENR